MAIQENYENYEKTDGAEFSRSHSCQALEESEMRVNLFTEIETVVLWKLIIDTGQMWVTNDGADSTEFAPAEKINIERFLDLIHQDDRERVRHNIEQAIQMGENADIEYRMPGPAGSARWIKFRGSVHFKSSGEPDYLIGLSLDITDRKRMEDELRAKLNEIKGLKEELEKENEGLREEIKIFEKHERVVGQSAGIKKVLHQIEQVAPTDSIVLITGETGTGKELVAREVHALSSRKGRPMVKVNCATLPATLIESELFGREKGAYTGALTRQTGRFEMADGGTIFLDEIGELPLDLQSKLLRVIQEGEFERLGSSKTIRVNVRVIAATNRNLDEEVRRGNFRTDLYYRLSVFPIHVPPLRERVDDISLLVWKFIEEFSLKMGKNIHTVPKRVMERIMVQPWPGNIRELRNIIEAGMIITNGNQLQVQLPEESNVHVSTNCTFDEAERQFIREALKKTEGRIKGPQGAAVLLGLKPSTLFSKMKKLGVSQRKQGDGIPPQARNFSCGG